MDRNKWPYTYAALRMVKRFLPTMITGIVAMLVWAWVTWNEKWWLLIGEVAIAIPYLVELNRENRRFWDEINRKE